MTGESVDVEALRVAPGRPQGGFKSEAGRAAYWRMSWEAAIGALADLIAEHTEVSDALAAATARAEAAEAAEAREAALRAGVEAFAEECERMSASHADPKVRVRRGRTGARLRALLATGGDSDV